MLKPLFAACANEAIKSPCSTVSGIETPRACEVLATAICAVSPNAIKMQAATIPDRPIPARQWMAICLPASRDAFTSPIKLAKLTRSGRPKSAIGKDWKQIPKAAQWSASCNIPRSTASSVGNMDRTSVTPSAFRSANVWLASLAGGHDMIRIVPGVSVGTIKLGWVT